VRWQKARASWYSASDSWGAFACTGVSFPSAPRTLGVAHLSLPCGTKVRILNPRTKRRITVRVIDRGPAAWTGRQFDLTIATRDAIGFGDVGAVLWRRIR
jgi:rare lipoprotein A